MKIEDLIIYGKKYIHSDLVNMLLAELLGYNSIELLMHLNDMVSSDIEKEFKRQVELVKNKKPIQYVMGNVDFYGNIIDINENVLIPRFETEGLVEKTINYIKKYFNEKIDIVDIGTGSGCIAISIKKEVDCNMYAVDISSDALKVAKHNIEKFDLDINLIEGDLLKPLNKKYNVIISNPPYISYDEEIMDIVKENEPHSALYAKDNGLYNYKEIIKNSKNYLKDKYILAFEIGERQGEFLKNYSKLYFKDDIITIEKDLSGKDRYLFIICKDL